MPFTDHEARAALTHEIHARPAPKLPAPGEAAYLALVPDTPRDRSAERAHLEALLDHHGAPHPAPGATHFVTRLGKAVLKWESHTEFVTYTILTEGLDTPPYGGAGFGLLPPGWRAAAPGRRITSALIRIELADGDDGLAEQVMSWLPGTAIAMARVLEDQMVIAGDFLPDDQGHMRFAIFARPGTGPGRIGRMVQSLCEIETYKTIAMLGLVEARALGPDLNRIADDLGALTSTMAKDSSAPEETLHDLLEISADLERLGSRTAYRFGGTAAYAAIVEQRIAAMGERRFKGRQTFGDFMTRRFDPAMRTVRSVQGRMDSMTGRAARAADLLRTRVDVGRSAQNQALLESMDRRADLQLRLQQTVEGLSVVAISYYALNLVTYALAPLAKAADIDKTTLTAGAVPVVVLAVWLMVRRIRKSVH